MHYFESRKPTAKQLLLEKKPFDVVIECGGYFFKLHALALAASSRYLRKTFAKPDWHAITFSMTPVKPCDMQHFLLYIYNGKICIKDMYAEGFIMAARLLQHDEFRNGESTRTKYVVRSDPNSETCVHQKILSNALRVSVLKRECQKDRESRRSGTHPSKKVSLLPDAQREISKESYRILLQSSVGEDHDSQDLSYKGLPVQVKKLANGSVRETLMSAKMSMVDATLDGLKMKTNRRVTVLKKGWIGNAKPKPMTTKLEVIADTKIHENAESDSAKSSNPEKETEKKKTKAGGLQQFFSRIRKISKPVRLSTSANEDIVLKETLHQEAILGSACSNIRYMETRDENIECQTGFEKPAAELEMHYFPEEEDKQ